MYCSRNNLLPKPYKPHKSVVLERIITNYLEKYFSHEKTFLSIVHCSSDDADSHLSTEFLFNLYNYPVFENISYSFLCMINGIVRYRGNTIYLIFIHNISTLP